MPKVGKPKSKRVPVRLRKKIEKASAAKQRKTRKLAKQNPQWRSRVKKDPGIPNLFPGKQQLLQEIEASKMRNEGQQKAIREEAKRRREGMGSKEMEQEGNDSVLNEELLDDEQMDNEEDCEAMDEDSGVPGANPMAALLASARERAQKFEQHLDSDNESNTSTWSRFEAPSTLKGSHAAQSHTTAFDILLASSDILLYILDARDPVTTRSPHIERQITSNPHKRLFFILNKADLVPLSTVRSWVTYLRQSFPTIPFLSASSTDGAYTREHAKANLTPRSTASALLSALKRRSSDSSNDNAPASKSGLTVGILGHPNTGKSTIVNSLLTTRHSHPNKRTKTATPTGAEAGVTTALRSIKLDSRIRLLDAPGIVFPFEAPSSIGTGSTFSKSELDFERSACLTLLNALPSHAISDPISVVDLLLSRATGSSHSSTTLSHSLAENYAIPGGALAGTGEQVTSHFLIAVARARGRLGKGGVPNLQSSAMNVLGDWWAGRIKGGWVDVPGNVTEIGKEAAGTSDPDEKVVVTEWAEEFKLDGLWDDDAFIEEDAGGASEQVQEVLKFQMSS